MKGNEHIRQKPMNRFTALLGYGPASERGQESGANEKAGDVCVVYVDGSGKVQWLTSSVYDSTAKVLRFSTNHFSTYGVGYGLAAPAFADIVNHPAKADIEYVVSRGLLSGADAATSGGIHLKFMPDQSITREQLAVIMSNYARAIGLTLPKLHEAQTFADSAKISSYARADVKAMQMAGIINGKNGNVFDPQGTATRAEVSEVLRRFAQLRSTQYGVGR